MKATNPDGTLVELENCWIQVGDFRKIKMKILPDVSDSKQATYSDMTAIGRSSPMKSYSHSDNRTISWTVHFMVTQEQDKLEISENIAMLQSAVYPKGKNDELYSPPPLCKIKCGGGSEELGSKEMCTILKSYSLKFPTDVAWDDELYLPYKLDMELQFEVVYNTDEFPYAEDIFQL